MGRNFCACVGFELSGTLVETTAEPVVQVNHIQKSGKGALVGPCIPKVRKENAKEAVVGEDKTYF